MWGLALHSLSSPAAELLLPRVTWESFIYQRVEALAPPEMEMQTEAAAAARQAKDSLELAFQMSQILDSGLDRHTLSLLMALCDRGANPEALAALVRELSSAAPPTAATTAASSPASNGSAGPAPATASMFPSSLRRS